MASKPRFKIDIEVGWTCKYSLWRRKRRFCLPDTWEMVTRDDSLEKIEKYIEDIKDFPKYYDYEA